MGNGKYFAIPLSLTIVLFAVVGGFGKGGSKEMIFNKKKGFEKEALENLQYVLLAENKDRDKEAIRIRKKELLIGDEISVSLKVNDEFVGPQQGRFFHASEFRTKLKSETESTFILGSVGIGQNAEDAKKTCMHEWLAAFGIALAAYSVDTASQVTVDDFHACAGAMGVRGDLEPGSWLNSGNEMHEKIIRSIAGTVNAHPDKLVSVEIMLIVEGGEVRDGQCRLGNEISSSLVNDLKKLDWPKQNEGIMFKQYYLIEK